MIGKIKSVRNVTFCLSVNSACLWGAYGKENGRFLGSLLAAP